MHSMDKLNKKAPSCKDKQAFLCFQFKKILTNDKHTVNEGLKVADIYLSEVNQLLMH